jgi:hypothetical protein
MSDATPIPSAFAAWAAANRERVAATLPEGTADKVIKVRGCARATVEAA